MNGETQIGFLEGYAVNGLSDMKTQKGMALIELLDLTRLLPLGEVAKQEKWNIVKPQNDLSKVKFAIISF